MSDDSKLKVNLETMTLSDDNETTVGAADAQKSSRVATNASMSGPASPALHNRMQNFHTGMADYHKGEADKATDPDDKAAHEKAMSAHASAAGSHGECLKACMAMSSAETVTTVAPLVGVAADADQRAAAWRFGRKP